MSGEYTISEDRHYIDGFGTRAYIKDGKFICDVRDEAEMQAASGFVISNF